MKILIIICLELYCSLRFFGAKLLRSFKMIRLKVKYDLKNPNNKTFPVSLFPIDIVTVGDYSYGPINIYTYYGNGEGLIVGKYCSIAKDVKFILGGNHRTDCFMTFPVLNKFVDTNINEAFSKGKIILEDDVWIGVGATLLSGVHLGRGCVVGAGSVVTKSFPPYSIIGGNPAKIIKMRFDNNILKKLESTGLKIDEIEPYMIKKNIKLYSSVLDDGILEEFISSLD